MRRTLGMAALVLTLGVTAVACGSDSGSDKAGTGASSKPAASSSTTTTGGTGGTGGPTIKLHAHEFGFAPTELSIPAGGATVEVTNGGSVEHNLTIEQLGVDQDVAPGSTESVAVTGDPGSFEFHCEYHPGTMKGTVNVG